MHRTTASLLHSPTVPHTTQLTIQHKLTLCESALMIRLNHATGLGVSTKEPQHHMQLMHFSAPI